MHDVMLPTFAEITDNFELLDEPEEQFQYLIELGRQLPPLAAEAHTDDRLVQGCESRVWLDMSSSGRGDGAVIHIAADSDAHITKGLIAFLVALFSGQTAGKILATDAVAIFGDLGLGRHVTSKRSSGLRSMVERIRKEARDLVGSPPAPAS